MHTMYDKNKNIRRNKMKRGSVLVELKELENGKKSKEAIIVCWNKC